MWQYQFNLDGLNWRNMSRIHPLKLISERIEVLSAYLAQDDSASLETQRHLDVDAVEHIYWHAGYQAALIDAMRMLRAANFADHNMDSQSDFPSDVRGEKSCH